MHGHALARDIDDFAGVTLFPGALYWVLAGCRNAA